MYIHWLIDPVLSLLSFNLPFFPLFFLPIFLLFVGVTGGEIDLSSSSSPMLIPWNNGFVELGGCVTVQFYGSSYYVELYLPLSLFMF